MLRCLNLSDPQKGSAQNWCENERFFKRFSEQYWASKAKNYRPIIPPVVSFHVEKLVNNFCISLRFWIEKLANNFSFESKTQTWNGLQVFLFKILRSLNLNTGEIIGVTFFYFSGQKWCENHLQSFPFKSSPLMKKYLARFSICWLGNRVQVFQFKTSIQAR